MIELRYGLRDGVEYTLEEIAELMGITNQAVSRIEERALMRMHEAVGKTAL